jgi:hypothetical protein
MASPAFGNSPNKSEGTKAFTGASGGGNANISGPTTSSREYAKGSDTPGDKSSSFNPQKVAATKIYVGGV